MNKDVIGKALKAELSKGYDVVRISRWAFRIFSENIKSLDPFLKDTLEKIAAMEDDRQFELTEGDLSILADKLISEGEKEELSQPVLEIKETVQELEGDWVMCPLCQEVWENHSKYGMVRCPRCSNKLHNPKFKPSKK